MSERYDFYSENSSSNTGYAELTLEQTRTAFIKSYLWMFVGAIITFLVGLAFSNVFANMIVSENVSGLSIFLVMFLVAFVIEMILGFVINKNAMVKLNYGKALGGFIVYSALNGFTFSVLFAFFDVSILYQVFGVFALYYLLLTAISFLFRKSIHKLSSFAWIGLITLLIVSIIVAIYSSIFLANNENISMMLYLGISILGLIVFTILTLVDIQAMKRVIEYSMDKRCASIAAAFSLYLDFINIFMYILRILMILGRNTRR